MKTRYHIEITSMALQDSFGETELQTIIHANIRQDRLRNQIFHDYIHFDGSAFDKGFRYIHDQFQLVFTAIRQDRFSEAQQAFGRLLHSWQDFYSHSNYIHLWRQAHPDVPAALIEPALPALITHFDLRSGRNYGLLELLSMIPALHRIVMPVMPSDSHAVMNIDSPESSPLFEFTYHAALSQTRRCLALLFRQFERQNIPLNRIKAFCGTSPVQLQV